MGDLPPGIDTHFFFKELFCFLSACSAFAHRFEENGHGDVGAEIHAVEEARQNTGDEGAIGEGVDDWVLDGILHHLRKSSRGMKLD